MKASRIVPAVIAAALWLGGGTAARAQTEDVLPPPVPGVEHAVPELVKEDLEVQSRWFTMHLGLVPIFDYTWFTQDQASIDQVGVQENDFDIRSARIMARGTTRWWATPRTSRTSSGGADADAPVCPPVHPGEHARAVGVLSWAQVQ